MSIRLVVVMSLVVAAALASGCVEERVVHDRPVYVQQLPPPPPRQYVEVVAPTPPPPVVVEEVHPRMGYIWAHSYYRWDGRRYVLVRGHWEPVRPGYHYVHPYWEQRPDGWHWHAGVWVAG